jgi:hypothetical protein
MADARPDFFALLGLAPPITVDDVKQAYLARVKTAHPDHGGATTNFLALQDAFNKAIEYATFRTDRMKWLGVQAERYAAQEAVTRQIEQLGGRVEVKSIDWMKRSFGEDFAQLMDRIVGVELRGPHITDHTLELLVREQPVLQQLQQLDLTESKISNLGVLMLRVFQELRRLDLTGTPVNNGALHIAEWLPELEWLGIGKTQITLLGKMKTRFLRPRLQLAS